MARKPTSIRIEEKLVKGLKYLVYKKDTTQTDLINKYIEEGLRKDGVKIEELEI